MWRGENGPRAFQAPVDVHASADGQVYMFRRKTNECAASSDDEELCVMELRPRAFQDQKEDRLKNVQLLEREVLADDNLNKLALQYSCKVADIKRVNNLMQEQDLFALKSIKIPVQKHSFLTETFSNPSDPQEEMPHASQTPVEPQNKARAQPDIQEASDFLMEVDNDINKLIQTTTYQDEDFLDNLQKQQNFGFKGPRRTSYGADWGINWWNAVVAMVLIGIVLPLFYVIYITTKGGGSGALHSNNTSDASSMSLSPKGDKDFHEPG